MKKEIPFMEQIIKDFVKEMFAISKIPHHEFAAPCSNYEWLDFGFRTKILGISNSRLNPLLNRRFMELPSHTILYCTDIFQFHYIFMRNPDPDHIYCIGPVIYERTGASFYDELFDSLHIPKELWEPIRSHYSNVKYIPYLGMLDDFTSLCANRIFGKGNYTIRHKDEKEFPDWSWIYQNYLRVPDEPYMNIRHIEDRYETENALMKAVSSGNEALAVECANHFFSYRIPQRLSNHLRDDRDLCITLNTILRKSAEHAGVHPIHIDSFSNGNIQQIERLASAEQLLLFQNKMVKGYCRLVAKYNLKDYSLPIQKAITYISTDLTADLSLKSLANQVNVNASYLSTLFKKEVGVPLTEYVNRNRIEYSKTLLSGTDLAIKTIAIYSGIPDIQYFTRMFKRITGMTPKAYRTQSYTKEFS